MLLKAQTREVIGKKVRQLRNQNLLPAVLYGPSRKSTNIMVDPAEFRKLYKDVGFSKLFDLELEDSKVKVLVKDLQKNTLTQDFIHIDLYQVNMNKPITAEIPVEVTGESFAVKNNIGLLVNPISSIAVQCLPGDLPPKLVVSIDNLNEIGDSISVEDIKLPEGVQFDTDVSLDTPVIYIAAPQKTVEEEEAEAAEAEGETEEVAEGEEAKEGEQPEAEEKKE